MEWVETTAKSIEEAKDLALDKLGVDEADAEFEVIEEPRQGLFGRTRGEARVRARVEPKAPRAKDERRDRKRRKPKSDAPKAPKAAATAATTATATASASEPEAADAEPAKSTGGRGQRSEAKSGNGRSNGGGRSNNNRGGNARDNNRGDKPERKESSMEEVRTCVDEFLTGLVAAFEIDTPVNIDDSDEQIMATIEGKHGLLLGPKARTLDAIQELTRVTAQRTAPSAIRIKVDVGGYREARRVALAGFAEQAAIKAAAEGVDVVLEPMSSADRKVVHDTLNDAEGVSTRSAGTDPRRYVIVVPDVASTDADGADDDASTDEEE